MVWAEQCDKMGELRYLIVNISQKVEGETEGSRKKTEEVKDD